MEWSGWRLAVLNVVSVALMLAVGLVGVWVGIWLILFIGDHAFDYGKVCQLC